MHYGVPGFLKLFGPECWYVFVLVCVCLSLFKCIKIYSHEKYAPNSNLSCKNSFIKNIFYIQILYNNNNANFPVYDIATL